MNLQKREERFRWYSFAIMKKLKKIIPKICVGLTILIPIAALAHFIIFPQETRSILVDFSGFKKDGRVYFNATTPKSKIDSLQSLIEQAAVRMNNFWGEKASNPKFIYCEKEKDFKKYCINSSAPAVTYLKLGGYIVLSADAMNLDIISHEFSHAELYKRIGFFKFNYKIPAWFKHGLAMQNDDRDYYSEDTLKAKTNNFKNLPDVVQLQFDQQFYAGPREKIMLNYMAAKHAIKNWYTKEKLSKFITSMNAGKPFEEAFRQ